MRLLVDLEQGLLLGAIAFSAFKWAWKRLTSAGQSLASPPRPTEGPRNNRGPENGVAYGPRGQ